MASTRLLTRDDLEELGQLSFTADDPFAVAARLVEAVEKKTIAIPADYAFALMQASEIYERAGDISTAERLARWAVHEHKRYGDPRYGYPQAYWGALLAQLGHRDEAIAEWNTLRPLLLRDPIAVEYMSECISDSGMPEIAIQWFSSALQTLLARQETATGHTASPEDDQAAFLIYTLVQERRRLRSKLGFPCDEYDSLAARLHEEIGDALDSETDEEELDGISVLFWPQQEFNALLKRWPTFSLAYGYEWNEYRLTIEQGLSNLWETGCVGMSIIVGHANELEAYIATHGGDPMDDRTRQNYIESIMGLGREIMWPPGHGDICWCGSRMTYGTCCLRGNVH